MPPATRNSSSEAATSPPTSQAVTLAAAAVTTTTAPALDTTGTPATTLPESRKTRSTTSSPEPQQHADHNVISEHSYSQEQRQRHLHQGPQQQQHTHEQDFYPQPSPTPPLTHAPPPRRHSPRPDPPRLPQNFHPHPPQPLLYTAPPPPQLRDLEPEMPPSPPSASASDNTAPDTPPTYTIDLSTAPERRYDALVADFRPAMLALCPLFDEVVAETGISVKTATRLARLFLRKVGSREQTRELRGISRASGVGMDMLVAFNVLLDLFMGCTSGGVRVRDTDTDTDSGGGTGAWGKDQRTKMLHFRTLDWDMDALRRVVVQLEYVSKPHGAVVARAITYVGFVGVLTGVRPGLSMSLNFRPYHNGDASLVQNLRFFAHLGMVLLGWRPSVSALLRQILIPEQHQRQLRQRQRPRHHHSICLCGCSNSATTTRRRKPVQPPPLPRLKDIKSSLPPTRTTAAYLIFSDGTETAVFEKDVRTAAIRTSRSFVAITNSDVATGGKQSSGKQHKDAHVKAALPIMQDLVAESEQRRACMEASWRRAKRHFRQRNGGDGKDAYVTMAEVIKWLGEYPVTNEGTHYAAVMDPARGEVAWCRRWVQPLEAISEEEGEM